MDSVKRGYRSGLRADQAARTRSTVVSAAAELFVDRGYAGTTIDAVAYRAGVSRKTVFSAVGGKPELLKLAVDWAVAGDDQAVALADREEFVAALGHDDPVRLITDWVDALVAVDARVSGLFRALEVAAESDESARTLRAQYHRQRLAGARVVVDRLTDLGALTGGLTRSEAVDIAWLATDPVLFDRMVGNRGWSQRRFRTWLAALLCTQLLTA
ncbi:TetR/AcrR family transcriptional regulator [Mycobacterium sp. NPDC003323]